MQGVNQGFESASGKLYNFLENLETEVNVINIVRGLRNQRTKGYNQWTWMSSIMIEKMLRKLL